MAASSAAVSVLTPNGRRQTVKVSPNTPLLQVLEDVCKKHGFNPDEHGLKFQRLVLDLSLQWRFASLPNNAKLEMVVCSRPQTGAESAVRIALQMEDGSRLQGSFSRGQTLWDLLTHFPQTRTDLDTSGPTPVCVYMRDEVSGKDALKKTTLKSLGLTGGSAIIRYVLKGSGSSCPAASVDAVAMPTDDVAKTTVSQPPPEPPEEPAPVPMETPAPPTEVAAPPNHHPVKQEEEEPSSSREQGVWPKTDQPPQAKLMPQEDDERPGTSQQCHGSAPSATPTDFVPFSGSGQRLGGTAGLKMSTSWSSCVSGSPPKAKKPKPSHEIKRSVSAKQATRDEEETDEFLEPVDREPLVFHLDSGARRHDDAEIPDEFFEVTVDDIRKRFAQLKSERKALEEAPLVTKSLRESQMKEKLDRYPKVALRVQFPDRHVLQGFFRPLETVAALRTFIQSHLQDPQMQFYLFVAPPKTILDEPNVTLFQASLFPAALVYFGSDVRTDGFLRSDLLDVSVSTLQADELIAGCMPHSPPPVSEDDPPPAPESCDSSGQRGATEDGCDAQTPAVGPLKTDPGKVPKWLKLPGKK
ncbi:tether containing UBX domain for GLUT4 [Sinocyclocheilus rhinocerous]|uniref:UBX domain-containing protein n=1 Tax=Sinocyclocheilus rhinocerous TaxID=307959 RepID=A0A673I304_9TELE|nr:PREDICTED: tether containing UBX domain for GLUT4 [Sinocyclocheilus rhinocerous]